MRVGGSNRGFYLLCGIIAALMAGHAYLFRQVRDVSREAAGVRDVIVAEVSRLREAELAANEAEHQRLVALRAEVDRAKLETAAAAGRANRDAQRRAEQLARLLAAERNRRQRELAGELTHIRAVTIAARETIGELSGELVAKKAEAALARSGLERTAAELNGISDEIDDARRLAAGNLRELAAFRARRDRRYYVFELTRSETPQRIGEVAVLLRKADPRRNTYTIELIARDRRFEQRDRNLNEPVRFYLSDVPQPYELVVNEIGKDLVRGYLAAPRAHRIATN